MATQWIQGVSIALCDACERQPRQCKCDYRHVNAIFAYAQENYETGWEYICESFTHEDLLRFIFDCHRSNTPPTYVESLSYVRRLVTAHNAR